MTEAYDYVIKKQKRQFCLESDYVYTAVDGTCQFSQYSPIGSISSHENIPEGDEDYLAAVVEQYGPVSFAIDASNWSFQLYSEGIYDEPNCNPAKFNLDCSCVGFGVEGDTKYWIVCYF